LEIITQKKSAGLYKPVDFLWITYMSKGSCSNRFKKTKETNETVQ